jgi:hypothetical protein
MQNKPVGRVVAGLSLMLCVLAACAPAAQPAPVVATATAPVAPTVVPSSTAAATATVAAIPTEAPAPTLAVTPPALPTATPASFADPFVYCAAVGTIDQPDALYTGPQLSDTLFKGYLQAAGLDVNGEFPDAFKKMTLWRCMDKQVYACNFGANLPCDSKADTNNTPTPAMADFCQASPNSDFIPMAVTGHATIYSWHCVKDKPAVLEQIDQADAAGYLTRIWVLVPAAAP